MGLTLPVDHGSPDVWSTILSTVFDLIDAHDHTTLRGAQVPMGGIKVDADKSWSFGGVSRAITDLKAVDFVAVAASTVTALAGALFLNSADNNLYYRTTAGSNVQLTNGAALNVAAFAGGIGGDYSAVGALEIFDDATDSYWFQQQLGAGVRQYARMRCGDVDLYEYKAAPTAGPIPTNRVRLASPAALAASYALTMPGALPAAVRNVSVDATGQLSFSDSHGLRTQSIAASLFAGSTAPALSYTGGGVGGDLIKNTAAGSAFLVFAPIVLPVGSRILAVRVFVFDSAVGPTKVQATFVSVVGTTGVPTAVASSAVSAGSAAFQTLNVGALTTTMAASSTYVIKVASTTGTDVCGVVMAEVDYDRP